MPYFLWVPKRRPPRSGHPLLIFLHGGIWGVGPHQAADFDRGLFTSDASQERHPCYILRPLSLRSNWIDHYKTHPKSVVHFQRSKLAISLDLFIRLLRVQLTELPVDPDKLILTGASMGGYGVWELLLRFPTTFTAAVPICGGGDPEHPSVQRLTRTRVWAFHTKSDGIVGVNASRWMFSALVRSHADLATVITRRLPEGKPPFVPSRLETQTADRRFRYTEYARGTHYSAWELAFIDARLADWAFGGGEAADADPTARAPRARQAAADGQWRRATSFLNQSEAPADHRTKAQLTSAREGHFILPGLVADYG